jgi:hypothetical protein
MVIILWIQYVKTDTLTIDALTNMAFWFVIIFIGHVIQSSMSRKLKLTGEDKAEEALHKTMENQIDTLIREAANLDHAILN